MQLKKTSLIIVILSIIIVTPALGCNCTEGGVFNNTYGNSTTFATGVFNNTKITGQNITLNYDFGNGSDGNITITTTRSINLHAMASGRTYADGIAYRVNPPGELNNTVTRYLGTVNMSNGIAVGDELLIINMKGTSADNADVGKYEFLKVSAVNASTITFTTNITNSYDGTTASNQKVVVQRVPQYTAVNISSAGTLEPSGTPGWDNLATTPTGAAGYYTGIIAFRVSQNMSIEGTISVNEDGFTGDSSGSGPEYYAGLYTSNGGDGNPGDPGDCGYGGEGGYGGSSASTTSGANGADGVDNVGEPYAAGAGGAGNSGGGGGGGGNNPTCDRAAGAGGGGGPYKYNSTDATKTTSNMTLMTLGAGSAIGGGGGGGSSNVGSDPSTGPGGWKTGAGGGSGGNGGAGSDGGGIIFIAANNLVVRTGTRILAGGGTGGAGGTGGDSGDAYSAGGGGGGGAQGAMGGTIYIIAANASFSTNSITAVGGTGGAGGAGGASDVSGGAGSSGATFTNGNDTAAEADTGTTGTYSGSGGGGGGGNSGYAGKIKVEFIKVNYSIPLSTNPDATNLSISAGTFDTPTIDANKTVNWSQVVWSGYTPTGTNIYLRTRTSTDNVTFTAWTTHNTSPSNISANARYIQASALLNTSNYLNPQLTSFYLNYIW